jgi:hypothetical protein
MLPYSAWAAGQGCEGAIWAFHEVLERLLCSQGILGCSVFVYNLVALAGGYAKS